MSRLILELDDDSLEAIRVAAAKPKPNPFTNETGGGEHLIRCPYCGDSAYAHLGDVVVNQNGFVVTVSQDGPSCRREEPRSARGSTVSINYWCECGHHFRHDFQFHKGQTFVSVAPLGSPPEPIDTLWRS